jgi:cell wall-associated NlpC family hydrolase
MELLRQAIIAEARTWLRTPYHQHGTLKGQGVDCAMLPIAVYAACGVIAPFDPGIYPPDWHMHRNDEKYLNLVRARSVEVDQPQPGDFALFRIGRVFAHGGICIGNGLVIHASLRLGVVTAPIGKGELNKPVKYFDPFADR